MTKRFTYDGMDIEDNVEMIEYAICTSDGGLRVTELLNMLHEENQRLKKEKDSLIQGIQDSAKMSVDGIVKSMDKNFTIDTKYYRRRL